MINHPHYSLKLLPLHSMFKNKHIQVFISLLVIIMMMCHMAIPHTHHHHEEEPEAVSEHSGHDHHHDHAGDHQHHDAHQNDKDTSNDRSGMFLPVEKHLHSFHVHEFVPVTKTRNHASDYSKSSNAFAHTGYNTDLTDPNHVTYQYVLFRPIFYDNPFLLNCSLRAPPYSV